jgi:spermidine synthase
MVAGHAIPVRAADGASRAGWVLALLPLFMASGSAALIYEVVWFQLLQLAVGSSAVSLAILLSTFMGGMCLGSVLLPRCVGTGPHPLRVFGCLELAIGAFGIAVFFIVPFVASGYAILAGSGHASIVLRAIVAGVCLLPPTILMGGTFPAVARWIEVSPAGLSRLGYVYGANLAGAVVGCVAAGFYLLRLFDIVTATWAAVALNVAIGALAFGIASILPYEPVPHEHGRSPDPHARVSVYAMVALSGFTALGAEVVWTRVLSLVFGATTYSFSLILAVFLLGLGGGSVAGSELAGRTANPRAALGWCQLLVCVAMAWAASAIASLPYWPIDPSLATDPFLVFQLDLMRAVWVMLPATILWGASFPFALAALGTIPSRRDAGPLVGRAYAANTIGAIVGALATGLVLVGTAGTQLTQQILIGAAALSAIIGSRGAGSNVSAERGASLRSPMIATPAIALVGFLLASTVPRLPPLLVAYGRFAASSVSMNDIVYVGEGVTAAVAVSRTPTGVFNYHNAGKVQASSEPQDMRLQRMLGHITTLVPAHPRNVLVIGCGAGVTAGAVSIDPLVEHETIAEIEPLVPDVVSTYFADYNFDVVQNPKVKIHLDDARHYLLTTRETFDAITSDPLDPWVKGAATLYTREFFELVKQRLNPGGVLTLFVQLYETNEAAVKSEVATFFEAFPNGAIFANTVNDQGYDLVLFGQHGDERIDVDRVQARLSSAQGAPIAKSLAEIGIGSAVELFGAYAGSRFDTSQWLRDAVINTDRSLRLQYLAGLGLNLYTSPQLYLNMTADTHYPEHLFDGSPETLEALRAEIARALAASRPES